jgi:hypothetical protein
MLMYDISGEFGSPEFRIIAREFFLLDVGSSAYTEYDPSDAELIKHLMANPHLLEMKKGHIHSHAGMNVFFSGTDTDELHDNSEFHNFYFSLIVNNKHEMCAKVAFRATSVSTTHTTLKFVDEQGVEKSRKLEEKQEETCVYIYPCVLTIEDENQELFTERILALRERKRKNEEELRKAAAKTANAIDRGTGPESGWRGIPGWDDIDTGRGKSPGLFDDWEEPRGKGKGGKKGKKKKTGKVDPNVYRMLVKLLNLNRTHEGSLESTLKVVQGTIYKNGTDPNLYYEMIERRAPEFYEETFPDDPYLTDYAATVDDCIDLLGEWESIYPQLVEGLKESLNFSIR